MIIYSANGVPSEDDEEGAFARWLDLKHIWHTHLSNETWTESWKQKQKMKLLGVHSGTPDHMCCVPSRDGSKYLTFVEMKRTKGGVISDNQFTAISEILECKGVLAFVAEGAAEARQIIEAVEKADWDFLGGKEDEFYEKKARREKIRQNPPKPRKITKKPKNTEKNDCPF